MAVRSKLENERDKLNEEIARRDKSSVKALYRRFGLLDDDDERFWVDDDDVPDFEENQVQESTDSSTGDIAEGIRAGLQKWEEENTTPLQSDEARARYVEIHYSHRICTNWI